MPKQRRYTRWTLIVMFCQLLHVSVEGQEEHGSESCMELGFNQPDCTDCDRIGDYIKDEGLVAECRGCCTQATNNTGIKFRSAVLEVCSHRLREFPHVETFVKEHISSYPNMKVKYYFGAPPRLNLKAGSKSETIRIDKWKTEHIEEYLKDKLLSPQFT